MLIIKISNLNSRVHGNSGSRSSGHAISGSIGFGIGRSRNFSPLVNLTAGMLARVLYTPRIGCIELRHHLVNALMCRLVLAHICKHVLHRLNIRGNVEYDVGFYTNERYYIL